MRVLRAQVVARRARAKSELALGAGARGWPRLLELKYLFTAKSRKLAMDVRVKLARAGVIGLIARGTDYLLGLQLLYTLKKKKDATWGNAVCTHDAARNARGQH